MKIFRLEVVGEYGIMISGLSRKNQYRRITGPNTGKPGRFGRNTIFLEMDGGAGKSGVF